MSSGAFLSVFIIAVIAVFVASYLPRIAARVQAELRRERDNEPPE